MQTAAQLLEVHTIPRITNPATSRALFSNIIVTVLPLDVQRCRDETKSSVAYDLSSCRVCCAILVACVDKLA